MARTKRMMKRSQKRYLLDGLSSAGRYKQFEVLLARMGYASWADVPLDFVSCEFIYESALGVSHWAYRARCNMMLALQIATKDSVSSLFAKLPTAIIDYMIFDAGRF